MTSKPNLSMVDHPLDMFMSAMLFVLVTLAMLHIAAHPVLRDAGASFAAYLSGAGLLVVDGLMFANSFMRWRLKRIDAEETEEDA
jgi:hypothetical protein